jgi:CBS domain-containing protein
MRAATQSAATKPFLSLTAADLMTAPVTTIPHDLSLREAAHLLSQSHISGAPVVDPEGKCIGVLSSSDFVTWVDKEGQTGQGGTVTRFIAPWGEWINVEDDPDREIRHYMTAQPVTVTPKTPIGQLAQMMVDAHIHRILVVIDGDQPCGIVTSTDILAVVAQAARGAFRVGGK